ncbi:PadR family transcriptional regulator [Yinghuangia soli]|uniref:PadR family transcriptional regulator n=1 Tax=Yinghuangia soli TaxID=2908204 RepID=A0AA41U691_9ACTN|nr:PadR family transcriptional regulator [Yinghuangia soli]MCF2530759.1 PadR family transcriptional regulator [Yinghuangia soli]
MALRHAVLAALLDAELSGYQLAKNFDAGVANFWHALPQQVYAELARLEADGLVSGREVVQDTRPNKRMFKVTDTGIGELQRFAATTAKPTFLREDLLVQVQACDLVAADEVIARLDERAAYAAAKVELFGGLLDRIRGDRTEAEFLQHSTRIGPYLTCLRGLAYEQANRDWAQHCAAILRERQKNHARD